MPKWKRFRRRLRRAAKSVIATPERVARNVRKTVTGEKSLEEGVRDAIRIPIRPIKEGAEVVAAADEVLRELTVKLASKIGGTNAESLVNDLNRLVRIGGDPALAVAALESVDKFVETGDPEYLNPINVYVLREIQQTRDLLWDLGRPVPPAVLDALPNEVDQLADGVEWVTKEAVPGNLSWPSIAFRHSDTRAIVFIDIIVFRSEPSSIGCDLALWTHELFHVKQYRAGAAEFTKRYLANEMGFRPVGQNHNALEVEADMFACGFFPDCEAVYLPGRRCPSTEVL